MALIHLTIVSPQGKFYEADAQRVMVRTTGGEVAILPHHIDYAAALGKGEARVTGVRLAGGEVIPADMAIVGIGINALQPADGFPEELRGVAGAVFENCDQPDLRCRLAAALLDRFYELYQTRGSDACFEAYRERCLVLGRRVTVLSGGIAVADAEVLDLERDYSLRVRYDDGLIATLNSGEVRSASMATDAASVRPCAMSTNLPIDTWRYSTNPVMLARAPRRISAMMTI